MDFFYTESLNNDRINKNYYQQALKYQEANLRRYFDLSYRDGINFLKKINKELINLLKNVINNKIELDITFCNILVIIDFIILEFHSLYSKWTIKYIQFLMYFIVLSVIGNK